MDMSTFRRPAEAMRSSSDTPGGDDNDGEGGVSRDRRAIFRYKRDTVSGREKME